MKKKQIYSGIRSLPRGMAKGEVLKGCLVLEGGAFRGLYSQGVLDVLMMNGIRIQTVIGVSAGALAGMNYVSDQIGRSVRANLKYRHDSRYIGVQALKKSGSILNLDFLLKEYERYETLDLEHLNTSERHFVAAVTNCLNGETLYLDKDTCSDVRTAVKASASMPFISHMVKVDGVPCLDGGCSCKIPYQWALDMGFEKIIVVRTREREFRKPEKEMHAAEVFYKKYPDFAKKLEESDKSYNRQCEELTRLEEEGRIKVIAPSEPVIVGRLEEDLEKLGALYWLGAHDADARIEEIRKYLTE